MIKTKKLTLSKDATLFGFVIPITISSFCVAMISLVFLVALQKTKILNTVTL